MASHADSAAPFSNRRSQRRRLLPAALFLITLAVALLSPPGAATAMSFWRAGAPALFCASCGATIVAQGQIDDGAAQRFLAFMREMNVGGRPVVLLNSGGGKIVAGMELGRVFRRLRATVIVAEEGDPPPRPSICFSACVYAFIGGARRIAPPGSQLGVHRMFAPRGDVTHYATPEMTQMLRSYMREMGVDPKLALAAENVASERIRILTRGELVAWRLAGGS